VDGIGGLLGNVSRHFYHAVQLTVCSHPFVERLIGTVRREYLDRTLFWTAVDLEKAAGVPGLLQQLSNPSLIGGANTRQEGTTTRGESDVLSMATALSRFVPETDRCVIVRRLRCMRLEPVR
jgi:hypothetical protein